MKKDKTNVDYKKITVEIPKSTYLKMCYYCSNGHGGKDIFYCDLVNLALLEYFGNHL